MTAPFTLYASSLAGDVGADAATAGAGGAFAAAAPVAIPAAIAAYAFSPTVRKYVNNQGQRLIGGISTLGNGFMNGLNGTLDTTKSRKPGFNSGLGQTSDSSPQIDQPIPPHSSPIINLPQWQNNPDIAYYPSLDLPKRSFY